MSVYEQVQQAADAVQQRIGARQPRVGLVLGSGLGGFAGALEQPAAVPYGEIPGFAESGVQGHAGRLVAGTAPAPAGAAMGRGGVEVLAMQGRVHVYEGHPLERVVLPVRMMVALGCRVVVITNACGGIRADLSPGDLVLITDHINLSGRNPLVGHNDERLGPRFPDMSAAYDPGLRTLALRAAQHEELALSEGVYGWMLGPSYETPAEIRMLGQVGADLAGMSTVPEVIAAHHMGARILGISCVTNLAAGLGGALSHDEVKETAARVRDAFTRLLTRVIALIGAES